MSEWFETFRNATFKKVVRSSYISIQKHFFFNFETLCEYSCNFTWQDWNKTWEWMNEWMEFPWVFSCSKFAITELFKIWVQCWYSSDSLYDNTRITMIRGCVCPEFPKFQGLHYYCVWNMAVLWIFNAEEYLSL